MAVAINTGNSNGDRHLPEPWEVGFGEPVRPYVVAVTRDPMSGGLVREFTITAGQPTGGGPFFVHLTPKENARRIVAAVNACAGIPTEVLEAMPLGAFAGGGVG